ncbi:MAG TPA: hypothetical protein ENF75_07095 [Acidilobales archaeon]|nr:MAG: hypothetical protein B6U85_05815 [Desulfurococcales archaeon ex4484_42]HDD26831.1 hypothetical protein [Acidilobales archaeon]
MSQESKPPWPVSDEDKSWGIIAWAISFIGAILALVLKPQSKYAKYWAYLSIAFFIIWIIAWALIAGISLALMLAPTVGWFFSTIIRWFFWVAVLIVWIIGIIKAANVVLWKPPIIYDLAKTIGIDKI